MSFDMSKYYNPSNAVWLNIKPGSFDLEQRREAVEKSAAMDRGTVMEVRSTSTMFYADADVPVGHVKVYVAKVYAGTPEYDTTLTRADEEWAP